MRRTLVLGLLAVVISIALGGLALPVSATEPVCEYVQVNQYWVRQCTVPATTIQCQETTFWHQGVSGVIRVCYPTRLW